MGAVRVLVLAVLAATLATLVVAPVRAGLTVELAGGPELAMDGSQSITATLRVDCTSVLARGTQDPVPVLLDVQGGHLVVKGPSEVDVPQPDCVPDEAGTWSTLVKYNVTGSRYLPAFVPLAVNATASFGPSPTGDAVDPVAPQHASLVVLPAPRVEFAPLPVGILPTSVGAAGLPIDIGLRSGSNLALGIDADAAPDAAYPAAAGTLQLPPTQRNLTVNGQTTSVPVVHAVFLPAATAASPNVTAQLHLAYMPPATGDGVDHFVLTFRVAGLLPGSLANAGELHVRDTDVVHLAVPYSHPPAAHGSTPSARVGAVGTVAPTSKAASAATVVAPCLVALAAAARRRGL